MVNSKIVLGDIALLIECINGPWSSITLECSDGLIELGEEDRTIILNKLHHLLSKRTGDFAGRIGGVDVWCVASFSVKHVTVYAGVDADNICLFFESDAGNIFFKCKVNKEDALAAIAIIESF